MPLPNVLIIGAMKAGTTSLYMDLATHERGFLGHDKEPCALCSDDVLTPAGRARYEAIYAKARLDQIRCDASTGYTKRPDVEGAAERAVKVLPEDFKVIYMVRHPIERIISQHHHEHSEGRVGSSIDEEVRRHARYIQYSRYNYQLEPWLAAVGRNRVQAVRFEDYVSRRRETLAGIFEFLGVTPDGGALDEGKVYNRSEGKPVKTRFWHALQHHGGYRKYIRPLAPLKLRLAIRRLLLPQAPDRLPAPRPETIAFLRQSLTDDVRRLSETLGLAAPLWDDFGRGAAESSMAPENQRAT